MTTSLTPAFPAAVRPFAGAPLPVHLPPGAPAPRTSGAHGLDRVLFLDVNHFAQHTGWLHGVMYDYANYGVAVFGLLLIVGWWLARRRRDARVTAAAIWAVLGTLAAVVVAQPINHAVAEARPWESLPHALVIAGHSTDFSFPSDHATMAGAVTAGLFIYHRRLGVISAVLGVLMCFARVYIGAHYPQDVLAGFFIGAAVALIGYAIVRIPLAALVAALSHTPLRPLLTAGPYPLPRPGRAAGRPSTGPAGSPSSAWRS